MCINLGSGGNGGAQGEKRRWAGKNSADRECTELVPGRGENGVSDLPNKSNELGKGVSIKFVDHGF
jgi:hypothetical protein